MSTVNKDKKPFQLFNLPWQIFLIIALVVFGATYLGVLPKGMTGCFVFMIVLGTILGWIGDHTPIIKSYLGGGAIVCIFGSALLVYFGILPAAKTVDGQTVYNMTLPFGKLDLVGNIGTFFKTEGGFLDWYIAALITGSILGMNRKLLILPIMGGGMGAGATPLSKIFETSSSMTAAEALSVMTPAVAIGNAISIVLAGVLVKVLSSDKVNGHGALMKAGSMDPKELEISPEMQAKRDNLSLQNMGIGLLTSGAFFGFGFILAGAWKALVPSVTIHAYAWMIITVAICKITNIVPERIEIACYQWFQFIMKNLTNMLLVGIGICYLDIGTVVSSFSLTYLLLCAATCIGAFVGAALIGRLVGFYPFEAGITAGLCMSNMGGTGDVAVLSAANRMELMPFAQISSRLGGAVILLLASLMLSVLAQFIVAASPEAAEQVATTGKMLMTMVGMG